MFSYVLRLRHNLQILWPVVALIAVLVMDNFARKQITLQHLFSHSPVFVAPANFPVAVAAPAVALFGPVIHPSASGLFIWGEELSVVAMLVGVDRLLPATASARVFQRFSAGALVVLVAQTASADVGFATLYGTFFNLREHR